MYLLLKKNIGIWNYVCTYISQSTSEEDSLLMTKGILTPWIPKSCSTKYKVMEELSLVQDRPFEL